MERKRNPIGTAVKWIFIVIILWNIVGELLFPMFTGVWETFQENEESTQYSKVEIADVSAQIVSDYEGITPDDGYQMYRFDVTVNNKGTREEQKDYVLYISSGDGYVFEQKKEELSSEVTDTRIIPRGRTAVITFYAQVSEDSSTVEFITYCTPDNEEKVLEYVLEENAV